MIAQAAHDVIDYAELAIAIGINLVAISIFAIAIYFRRHSRNDLAMVFAFFNICLFAVVTVIQLTEIAAALGFGLFAILSIIRLRSEPFNNREIGYFFGALVIGLVNSIGTPHLGLTIGLNVLILGAILILDHPRILKSVERRRVTLDAVRVDHEELRQLLEIRLASPVVDFSVVSIDFVRDSMELEVQYAASRPTYRADFAMATTRQVGR